MRWTALIATLVLCCHIVHAQDAPDPTAAAKPGGKPVLAVLKFQDETGAMPFQGGIGRVVTNMLASEIAAREVLLLGFPGFSPGWF